MDDSLDRRFEYKGDRRVGEGDACAHRADQCQQAENKKYDSNMLFNSAGRASGGT